MPKATVVISADNQIQKGIDPAKRTLLEFQNVVSGIEKKISKAFTIAGIATATVASFKAITNAAKACIQEFSECERVSKRLEAVWANVGAATGKTAKEINDLADSLEKQTYFSAESIKEAGLLLAATESLTEEGFDRALQASMDLAAALGEDVTGAAQTLAKAIQEPESSLSRLKSIGVSFTEDEKKQIKALAEANEEYAAQNIILSKIEDKYKDVAKAINNTPAGTLDNIKDTLADIRKNLGQTLLDSISPALQALYGWLQKISQWVADQAGTSAIISLARSGGDMSSYSVEALQRARNEAHGRIYTPSSIAEDELNAAMGRSPWEDVVDAIDLEIKRRAEATAEEIKVNALVVHGLDELTETITNTDNSLGSFLKSNKSSSITYQLRELESSIALVENFIAELEIASTKESRQMLEDAGWTGSKNSALTVLNEIKDGLNERLESLTAIPALMDSPTLTDLDKILSDYGKQSNAYQIKELKKEYDRIAAVYEYASDEEKVYLKEILESNEKQRKELENTGEKITSGSFLDKLTDGLASAFTAIGFGSEQSSTAAGAVIGAFTSKLGDAGTLIERLASNMATMTPILGAIVTALQYVAEGLAETIAPILNDFAKGAIEPLKELGHAIGEILMPILQDAMPLVQKSAEILTNLFNTLGRVLSPIISLINTQIMPLTATILSILETLEPILNAIGTAAMVVSGVFSYVGQLIRHIFATVYNWVASIIPWMSYMSDPGNPGDFAKFMANHMTQYVTDTYTNTATDSAATQQALSAASYRGATSVTINIYAEAPIVGEGGMREFARMIRDEFDALNYYGVTT